MRSIVRCETFGERIRFSICWYTMMNTSTPTPYHRPFDPQANSTGSAPPIYVPTVGTNCDTMPQNNASGSQYGTWIISRKTAVQVALMAARMERENRKPEICSCTTVQPSRKRRCVFGPSHWHRLRRIFGPAAEI